MSQQSEPTLTFARALAVLHEGRAAALSGSPPSVCPYVQEVGQRGEQLRTQWARGYAEGRTELRRAKAAKAQQP